ncbi:MAG: penicillin-binding protein activator [Formivibrio sp.]|nr:penicillin-binding protein activator [Formivibrio sp.]
MHAGVLLGNKQSWGKRLRKLGVAAVLYGACLACASTAFAESVTPFIAVILPGKSNSKAFKLAVDTIKAGLSAAEKVHGRATSYPLRMFDVGDAEEETLTAFNQAQSQGAAAVIGPLTRNSTNYLADAAELNIPVLALNAFDETTLRRNNLYSFGLPIESEVQQVVQMMRIQKVAAPVVLQADGPLSQRMRRAFVDAWRAETGTEPPVMEVYDARAQAGDLQAQLKGADAVFFATDGRHASQIRPYLPTSCQLYGTSQLVTGRAVSVDLYGVHYVDMPWLANPDSPEYAAYARQRVVSNDEERLFAVGVDAWWLAQLLAKHEQFAAVDGLTGWLELGSDGVIDRSLTEVTAMPRGALPAIPADASQPAVVQ